MLDEHSRALFRNRKFGLCAAIGRLTELAEVKLVDGFAERRNLAEPLG